MDELDLALMPVDELHAYAREHFVSFKDYWNSPPPGHEGVMARIKSWEYTHLELIRKYCVHEIFEGGRCRHCRLPVQWMN